MKNLTGSCHCGKVKWEFIGPLESATACNCTACRRYGALWAYGYLGEEIKTTGATHGYTRGGKELGFHFCQECGCMAYWLGIPCDEKGRRRIAVNLRLADEPVQVAELFIDPFDGLDTFTDLPRDGRCVRDVFW